MGFFTALKNIALGKPVFTAPPQQQQNQPQAGPGGMPVAPPQQTGPKIVPQAYIERTQCRTEGGDMEVEVVVQNYAHEELLLDKIELLGDTLFLNGKRLSPGEEDEVVAYHGDRPHTMNARQCTLYYKNEAGDYFASVHNIEYEKLPDGTYTIRYIRFMPPVRDI